MKPELEKQILDKIKQIVKSPKKPYFEIRNDRLKVYMCAQCILIIDGTDEEFEEVKQLVNNISNNYEKHCLNALNLLSRLDGNPSIHADDNTGKITVVLSSMTSRHGRPISQTYESIYHFNWMFGSPIKFNFGLSK